MIRGELDSIERRWEPCYRPGGVVRMNRFCAFNHMDAVHDIGRLVAEVRRLRAMGATEDCPYGVCFHSYHTHPMRGRCVEPGCPCGGAHD